MPDPPPLRVKKYQLSVLSTVLFLLILEMIGRSIFFYQNSSSGLGLTYLYDSIQKKVTDYRARHTPGSGISLNKQAWEATFRERGLKVPPGPREGYWGSRIGKKQPSRFIRFTEHPTNEPGLVQIDELGYQHASRSDHPSIRILIVGGSVAFGAYASSIRETYFEKLVDFLQQQSIDAEVFVLAAGSWISTDELIAYATRGIHLQPDLLICLSGLNDLTTETGDPVGLATRYIHNMKMLRVLALSNGTKIVFCLQPFLINKHHKTNLEERVLTLSLQTTSNEEKILKEQYQRIQKELKDLATGHSYFIDCSDVMSEEKYTTFTDLWHFTDVGHTRLAGRLAEGLVPILK